MPTKTRKFTPEIDAQLYDEFVALAERMGKPSGMFSSGGSGSTCATRFHPSPCFVPK